MTRLICWCRIVTISLTCSLAAAAERTTTPPPRPLYKAAADRVYEQEVGRKVATAKPVTAVAAWKGEVYAISDGALQRLQGDKLQPVKGAPADLRRLVVLNGKLVGLAASGLYVFDENTKAAKKIFDREVVDLCLHNGAIHAATRNEIFRWQDGKFSDIKPESGWLSSDTTMQMEDGSQVLMDPVNIGPIDRIASYSGTLYLVTQGHIRLLDGAIYNTSPIDWGEMPSHDQRDVLAHGSRLFVATDRGLAVLRGAALTAIQGKNGLPDEDTTCLAAGFADDLWIGTATGAVRNIGHRYHYFGADHWLPADHVHAIAVDAQTKTVAIATDGGLGIIRYEPYTLAKKADYFQQQVAAGGHQRLGFVHQLYRTGGQPGDKWLREISDNDGGHTAHWLAAMSFKYAVTKDEAARREAVEAFEAMSWLQWITGTDGFFARAIWAEGVDEGQRATGGSGGLPAKWVPTKDGKWFWKGDTSSDEVNGHFYAVALFHDLVAQGDEKQHAAEHLAHIAKHIIDNGWVLRDVDGKPTRWGRWDPNYLQRPYGFESRGLNSMEAQTYAWTAYGLTGDRTFRTGLEQLVKWRYDTYTVREKLTFPPENVVTWDDELAFRCFLPLLTYCDDARLRSIYLRALARHWEVLRMQKLPWFNFIYGGLTGNDCEVKPAVEHLREWSLDTVAHRFRNSHRDDLNVEPGYTPYLGGTRAVSPREQACTWGSRSSIEYDGGSGGTATPPVGWLEDYWMGRFFGMIEAPTANDAKLTTLPAGTVKPWGAKPYDGPERPTRP